MSRRRSLCSLFLASQRLNLSQNLNLPLRRRQPKRRALSLGQPQDRLRPRRLFLKPSLSPKSRRSLLYNRPRQNLFLSPFRNRFLSRLLKPRPLHRRQRF